MLKCVVGRIRARSGSVLVFGLRPGEGHGEVPGRDVGYMPQEISIYEDFTIEETLRYFGKINRMRGDAIKERIDFLLQFLDLPSKRRLVTNLRLVDLFRQAVRTSCKPALLQHRHHHHHNLPLPPPNSLLTPQWTS